MVLSPLVFSSYQFDEKSVRGCTSKNNVYKLHLPTNNHDFWERNLIMGVR